MMTSYAAKNWTSASWRMSRVMTFTSTRGLSFRTCGAAASARYTGERAVWGERDGGVVVVVDVRSCPHLRPTRRTAHPDRLP
jgi:hypothetical protein